MKRKEAGDAGGGRRVVSPITSPPHGSHRIRTRAVPQAEEEGESDRSSNLSTDAESAAGRGEGGAGLGFLFFG